MSFNEDQMALLGAWGLYSLYLFSIPIYQTICFYRWFL